MMTSYEERGKEVEFEEGKGIERMTEGGGQGERGKGRGRGRIVEL